MKAKGHICFIVFSARILSMHTQTDEAGLHNFGMMKPSKSISYGFTTEPPILSMQPSQERSTRSGAFTMLLIHALIKAPAETIIYIYIYFRISGVQYATPEP